MPQATSVLCPSRPFTWTSWITTYRIEPAARARKQTETAVARPRLADEGAEERRRAADEAEGAEEAPRRPLRVAGERRDDPEALGGVVQARSR